MEQRLSLVTLGVADLGRARSFYERLGWTPTGDPPGVVFFQAGGIVVALWDRAALAADSTVHRRWRLGRRDRRPQRRLTG